MAAVTEDVKEKKTDYVFEEETHDGAELSEDDNDEPDPVFVQDQQHQLSVSLTANPQVNSREIELSNHVFIQDQHEQHVASLNGIRQFNSMEMESIQDDVNVKTDEVPSIVSENRGNLNHVDVPGSQQQPHPSTSHVWTPGNSHGSYYSSTNVYAPAGELSLGHPQFIEEQPLQMIDLERARQDNDAGKDMLQRQHNDVSFFTSFPNQVRNESLQSFFKSQGSLPCHQEQKQSGLDLQPAADLMMVDGQFSGHFREQVYPSLSLDMRQKRMNELYMHQNAGESMYSDGGRYLMLRQEHLTVPINDWSVNNASMSAHSLSHLNGELSHNWFPTENGGRSGWSTLECAVGVTHSIGSGSNSDQTLYSVLSECNELRPSTTYHPMGSMERFAETGNSGGMDGGIGTSSDVLQESANPFNYLSSHATATGLKTSNVGWMPIPHQTSGLHESMGKPFLKPWNQ